MLQQVALLGLFIAGLSSYAAVQQVGSPVVWQEGENYVAVSLDANLAVGQKAPASGGEALTGAVLNARPGVAEYAISTRRRCPNAHVLIRYSRTYWPGPSRIEVELDGEAKSETGEVELPDSGGWGNDNADEWGLARLPIGDLPAGDYRVTLRAALDEKGDVNVDGFFVVPESVRITQEELAACDRVAISHAGYVGVELPSATIRQDRFEGLHLASRRFVPADLTAEVSVIDGEGGRPPVSLGEVTIAAGPERMRTAITGRELAALPDGFYTLRVAWSNGAVLEMPVRLVGELAADFDGRLAALQTAYRDLHESDDSLAAKCAPDFQHAIDFLEESWQAIREGSATRPVIEGVGRTMDQYEMMAVLLKRDEDPYPHLERDCRLAFVSETTGKLEPYRIVLPGSYSPDGSTPAFMALNGTEDQFLDRAEGIVKSIADEHGYTIISPRASSGYFGRGQQDLVQVVEHCLARFPGLDATRVYCTGTSLGGFGTYALAVRHPEMFAAIACSSGVGIWRRPARPNRALVETFTSVPTLIIHGGMDDLVPPDTARLVASHLKELGYPYELHIYPTHGHSYVNYADEYLPLSLGYFDRYSLPRGEEWGA